MLPAGEITKMVMNDCLRLLKVGDILIDGGNSKYSESKKHNAAFTAKGITFLMSAPLAVFQVLDTVLV